MSTQNYDWISSEEEETCREFLEKGFIIRPASDQNALQFLQHSVATILREEISKHGISLPAGDELATLNSIHDNIHVDQLNKLRLAIFNRMNDTNGFRQAYYSVARQWLDTIVGNEIAMQRRVNLSIQFPHDNSSLLPVHADVWSGDSPFEVVLWIPLVDCYDTKSMFLLNADRDKEYQAEMAKLFQGKNAQDLHAHIEKDLDYLNIPFGQVLLFNQNIMHGNTINLTDETRWTMNCRFKSLLSPYHAKQLGDFFEPVFIRPATRIGMQYSLPGGFDE